VRYAETPEAAATLLAGRDLVSAEMMYRPRPAEGRVRVVFDYAFHSRLSKLGANDAVLLLCDSAATVDSLLPLIGPYPHLLAVTLIVNPALLSGPYGDTPYRCGWPEPEGWQRYRTTDRWTRIDAALQVGARLGAEGLLALPAHDAIWGDDLLPRLRRFADARGKKGLPAAVSPYTPYPHSDVSGADIPPEIIALMNATLTRDPALREKIESDQVQSFWGKMGLLPFGVCASLRAEADQGVWEDDLEIDRVLRALGYGVACLWVDDPDVYRQAPPVFDRDGVRRVIDRTLHYSLNVGPQASALTQPDQPRREDWFAVEGDALIAECRAAMAQRLNRYGASWVDWGDYRYVARVGDPYVEVWRLRSSRTAD
jgi:hypothetical protein